MKGIPALIRATKGDVHEHITVGIDLAKNVFAVHGVNETGQAELVKPRVSREKQLKLIASLSSCIIGMSRVTATFKDAAPTCRLANDLGCRDMIRDEFVLADYPRARQSSRVIAGYRHARNVVLVCD